MSTKRGLAFVLGPFFLSLSISSCVYGPPREVKSPLYYLNGDLYERDYQYAVNGLPLMIKRKPKKTLISGIVTLPSASLSLNPATPQLKILLTQGEKIITSTMVQENGRFFMEDYILNGSYQLKIDDIRYRGEMELVVSTYEIKDINLLVKETQIQENMKNSIDPIPME